MNRYLIILVACLSLVACKSRKKRSKQTYREFNTEKINSPITTLGGDPVTRQYWTYYSSRADFSYADDKQSMEGKIHVRMRKDSIIFFSVRLGIGIEAAKGMITADSAFLLNTLTNDYWVYATKELATEFGAEIGLRELQNLLIGNPVYDTLSYNRDSLTGSYFANMPPMQNVIFTSASNSIDSSFLTQKGTMRQLKCTYSDTLSAGSYFAPVNIIFNALSGDKGAQINYNIKMVSGDVLYSYPFKIPANATRKN